MKLLKDEYRIQLMVWVLVSLALTLGIYTVSLIHFALGQVKEARMQLKSEEQALSASRENIQKHLTEVRMHMISLFDIREMRKDNVNAIDNLQGFLRVQSQVSQHHTFQKTLHSLETVTTDLKDFVELADEWRADYQSAVEQDNHDMMLSLLQEKSLLKGEIEVVFEDMYQLQAEILILIQAEVDSLFNNLEVQINNSWKEVLILGEIGIFLFLCGAIVLSRNVSIQMRELRIVREEAQRLASLAEGNPNPVIEVATDGHIQYTNSVSQSMHEAHSDVEECHPLLPDIHAIIRTLISGRSQSVDREITVKNRMYEQKITYFSDFTYQLKNSATTDIVLEVARNNEIKKFTLTPTEDNKVGIAVKRTDLDFIKVNQREYSLAESVSGGISKGYWEIKDYLAQFQYIFTKKGASQIGGFAAIGQMFPSQWNWQVFWKMTAFLSIMLGVLNLLPIPALDGGHVMFLLYEIISGRKPGDKFMEYAQLVGFVLLIALVLFANGNDAFKAIQEWLN